ncbi:MAG TPA: ATP-binding protein [Gemmatimonadaceae bacterium]|nr:ATP-binding protein [Gemmatimonadaceae bacterium]
MTDDTAHSAESAREPARGAFTTHPEAWLAAIVESSDDAIVGKSLDGVIRSWNEGARRVFGYDADEIVGQRVYRLIPPELHHEEPTIVARLLRGERVDHFETVRLRKDGKRIDVSLSVSPIRNAAGEIIGAAKVARDVTEAKRLQRAEHDLLEQLQELTTELEQQVEEAQSLQEEVEQANNELVQSLADTESAWEQAETARRDADDARRIAQEANAAKSRFLATMSHELRTPLNAIVGYVELLEIGVQGPLTQAQRDALARIRRSGATLHRLIEDVLSFARLEAGKLEYRYEEVVLDEFVAALEGFIAPRLVQKHLEYHFDPSGANVAVSMDRDKVEQILLNLLSNAVKFTDEGCIEVRAHLDDEMFRIDVSDTGRGVREEFIDTIFQPFVQADRSLSRTIEGTGLGLSISRELARAMGGDVTVESVAGEGSTFTLRLPRHHG